MASTYTNNLGIEKPGTGDQAGTWGSTSNTNYDILDRGVNGVVSVTLFGSAHTLTTSDGALSDGQYKVIVLTGTPGVTNTVTVSPNDAQKLYFIKNTTADTVIISQGSGSNVTIVPGTTKIVYCDGAGATAAVSELAPPTDLIQDTSPQLGANLDLNGFDITGTGDINITGTLTVTGGISGGDGFAPGTKMAFQQTSAPTYWTKDTSNDDAALRIVSGTVGTGGTEDFSTAFANPVVSGTVTGTVGNTTLTIAQMPAHTHSITSGGSLEYTQYSDALPVIDATSGGTTGSTGGSTAHTHSLSGTFSGGTTDINVKYVDFIIATKN